MDSFTFTLKSKNVDANEDIIYEVRHGKKKLRLVIPAGQKTISNPTAMYWLLTNQLDKLREIEIEDKQMPINSRINFLRFGGKGHGIKGKQNKNKK